MQCNHCYTDNPEGNKFCGHCGVALGSTARPIDIKTQTPNSIDNFESTRKHLTVFFADVKGSTSLIEMMDPEETRELLKPVIEAMITAVHKYGGTVTKTAGDGIMALFGAPIAYEDHALRACYAALYLQRRVKNLKSDIAIRVGVNSGEVVVGVTNADLRNEYDAMGPVVSIAARMEQLADSNAIQLTADTYHLISHRAKVRSRGKVQVKGISEPMEIFELISIRKAFSRFAQMRSSQLSQFVGRKEAITTLNTALTQVLNGHGRIVGIVGEPSGFGCVLMDQYRLKMRFTLN